MELKTSVQEQIITMLQIFLPSEEDCLTIDKNSLVYQTHSLIGYATKERN